MNNEPNSFTFEVDFPILSVRDAISGLEDAECPYLSMMTGISIVPDGPDVDYPTITVTGSEMFLKMFEEWYNERLG
jgi:hypothetical protein